MKLTAADLLELGVIDEIIPEPEGGAHTAPGAVFTAVDAAISRQLAPLLKFSGSALARQRYKKFRAMGTQAVRRDRG